MNDEPSFRRRSIRTILVSVQKKRTLSFHSQNNEFPHNITKVFVYYIILL